MNNTQTPNAMNNTHTTRRALRAYFGTVAVSTVLVGGLFAYAVHNTETDRVNTCGPCWTLDNPNPATAAALSRSHFESLQSDPRAAR